MLKTLSIRNVVLIEKLDLTFDSGLCVLTGETGSGKSILLDALGLALGVRADSDLIKLGEKQSAVVAEFDIDARPGLDHLLNKQGIEFQKSLILRRVLSHDGPSRAFINDEPVSATFLREVGEMLVEVNGQMEAHGLLDPRNHGHFVDSFGCLEEEKKSVALNYRLWKEADNKLSKEISEYDKDLRDEEFLRHSVSELDELDPQIGEEKLLARHRARMMHAEKLAQVVNEALENINNGTGVDGVLRSALQKLERVGDRADGLLDDGIRALERALIEAHEAVSELEKVGSKLEFTPVQLEQAEERLFAIRALARKHGTDVAGLSSLREELRDKLVYLDEWSSRLIALKSEVSRFREQYIKSAGLLTKARRNAGKSIDKAIKRELPPLKLEAATFQTKFENLAESEWGENGVERLTFEVQTNPNTHQGPLHKIISGGELARLMLALKVVLAGTNTFPTIIFDEVDMGIGGATAAAVGDRLARLSEEYQVLVVTHSPQVAAKGGKHLRITKFGNGNGNRTLVDELGSEERTEEIARMLAGSEVTKAARAAANQLLAGSEVEKNLP